MKRIRFITVFGAVAALAFSIGGCPTNTSSNFQFEDNTGTNATTPIIRPPNANANGSGNGGGGGTGDNTNTNSDTGGDIVGLPTVEDDHILVNGNPRLTIVEYVDFQCPNCGRFARNTFPAIKELFIDTGKVRWVTRHLPLTNIHPNAQAAAEAAECANNQGRFDEYIEVLFNNQTALASANLVTYAQQLGLNLGDFQTCVDSRAEQARVDRDAASGRDLNIPGTPAFFIGDDLTTGFKRADEFSALINAKLAEIGE